MYEKQLNEFAAKVSGMTEFLASREGRKLSRRDRASMLERAASDPDTKVPILHTLPASARRHVSQCLQLLLCDVFLSAAHAEHLLSSSWQVAQFFCVVLCAAAQI